MTRREKTMALLESLRLPEELHDKESLKDLPPIFTAMGMQKAIDTARLNIIIHRINECDPQISSEDWYSLTNGFRQEYLEALYRNITTDDMFDVVTKLICAQHSKMETKKEIEDIVFVHDDGSYITDSPCIFLDLLRDTIRKERKAVMHEQETRRQIQSMLEQQNKKILPQASAPIITKTHDSSDTLNITVANFQAEIERLKKENEELRKQYEELESRKPEQAFDKNGHECFTSQQMGILMTAVGILTEGNKSPGKTTVGDVVERISGHKTTTVKQNMKTVNPKNIQLVFSVLKDKYPNLAAQVKKVGASIERK